MDFSRYEKLRTLVRANFSEQTRALVDEALEYADGKLAGLVRYDGSPLLEHAAAVASIVISEVGLGRNSTISAILHDVVRLAHKQLPAEEFLALSADIRKRFGDQVVGITLGLANISELKLKVAKEQADNFRDLIVSYSEDPRVILIKLADRLEVMRSLEMFPREKWRKKSWESMNLYAQIAHKLGLYSIKSELEDIALKYLEPKDYEHVVTKLEESAEERKAFIGRFLVPIEQRLNRLGIKYHIKSRTKSIFSIWNKMHKQHVPFEGVYDIFAIRIIIDCPQEAEKQLCWTAYSVVTDFYTPNPKRMRDWISIPKSNGYESLHTTVSAEGRWVEVQIRTERMDAVAERGIAAHWRYKEAGNSEGATSAEEQRVAWLRQLLAWRSDVGQPAPDAAKAVADDLIYCLTPQGRVVELPAGATPVDFAYHVHTELGHRTKGAKVNGVMVPLNAKLSTGDTVEIIAGKTGQPSRDWLNPELGYAASARTRNKVRQWFNAQQTQALLVEGRDRLDKELARLGKTAMKLDDLAKRLGFENVDDLCIAFAKEEVTLTALAAAVQPPKTEPEPEPEVVVRESSKKPQGRVLVVGMDSLLTQLARCCHPVPPDEIVGYVTRGRGVTIHRADCPNVRNMIEQDHERMIDVSWGRNADAVFPVEVLVIAQDRMGLLKDISELFMREKIRITGMSTQSVKGDQHMTFRIEIHSAESLRKTLAGLREVKGVLAARRA